MVNVTDIMYKCTIVSPDKRNKGYLRTAKDDFKKLFYNHKNEQQSFNNKTSKNNTTLPKYIWELKKR